MLCDTQPAHLILLLTISRVCVCVRAACHKLMALVFFGSLANLWLYMSSVKYTPCLLADRCPSPQPPHVVGFIRTGGSGRCNERYTRTVCVHASR